MKNFDNITEKDFIKSTLTDFYNTTGVKLNSKMSFDTAMSKIEHEEINYFYTSMCANDVIEAIQSEKDLALDLGLNLVCIEPLSIYIATY